MKTKLLAGFCLIFSIYTMAQDANKLPKLFLALKNAKGIEKSNILTEISGIYYATEKFDSSKFFAEEALVLSNEINYPAGKIKALSNLGNYYRNYGSHNRALEFLLQAIDIAEKNNLKNEILPPIGNISLVYSDQKDFKKALEYQQQLNRIAIEQKDTLRVIAAHKMLADTYGQLHDWQLCNDHIQAGLQLCSLASRLNQFEVMRSRMQLIFTLTGMLNSQEKFKEALEVQLPMYEQVKQMQLIVAQRYFLVNMAASYLGLQDYPKTLQCAEEILALLKKDSIADIYRRVYYLQSKAYAGMGNYDKAYASHLLHKDISDSLLNKENLAILRNMQVRYETEKKDEEIVTLNSQQKTQKRLIIVTLAAAALAIVSLIFVYRSKRLQKKVFTQRQEINKAELDRQMAEIKQMALRAQMNPHFIFNSINSVQQFVISGNIDGVNKYLSTFASLIRQTLDNSSQALIPVDEETKYLETYLSLEKMRTNNRFSFDIQVDPAIDRQSTMVPNMVIQPFVENSIKHGIANLPNQNGFIRVLISKNGSLVCTVEDNGIGVSEAKKLKAEKLETEYESKGMEITMNRVQTLNKMFDTNITIDINDRTDADNKIAGTKVKINLPDEL
jgi:tetratricopeptide (TPR) repeat protein